MLMEAAAQVALVVSEARTLARFIAPVQEDAALVTGTATSGGVGITIPGICFSIWTRFTSPGPEPQSRYRC